MTNQIHNTRKNARKRLLKLRRGLLSRARRRLSPMPDSSLMSRVYWGLATSARAEAAILAEIAATPGAEDILYGTSARSQAA